MQGQGVPQCILHLLWFLYDAGTAAFIQLCGQCDDLVQWTGGSIGKQAKQLFGNTLADGVLRLLDQCEVGKNSAEKIQLIKADERNLIGNLQLCLIESEHRAERHFEIGHEDCCRLRFLR